MEPNTVKTSELRPGMVVTGEHWSGPDLVIASIGPELDPVNGYTHAMRFAGLRKPWRFIIGGQGDEKIWKVKHE